MHDFPCAQEAQRRNDVGVVEQAEQIVVNYSCLLLCCDAVKTNF